MNLLGAGWHISEEFGMGSDVIVDNNQTLMDAYHALIETAYIEQPIKNFGRFDELSKRLCLCVGLALYEANINLKNRVEHPVSILGVSELGSQTCNMGYFKDYVESGRALARGNLFSYTLPTCALSEASIAYGLTGSVMALMPGDVACLEQVLIRHVQQASAGYIVVAFYDAVNAVACVLGREDTNVNGRLFDVAALYDVNNKKNSVLNIINHVRDEGAMDENSVNIS